MTPEEFRRAGQELIDQIDDRCRGGLMFPQAVVAESAARRISVNRIQGEKA
jgi:hypothetical protein